MKVLGTLVGVGGYWRFLEVLGGSWRYLRFRTIMTGFCRYLGDLFGLWKFLDILKDWKVYVVLFFLVDI